MAFVFSGAPSASAGGRKTVVTVAPRRPRGVALAMAGEAESGRNKVYSMEKLEEIMDLGDKVVSKYRFQFEIDPALSKRVSRETIAGFSQRSYPGFRKGNIPPFSKPKVKEFVFIECLMTNLDDALKKEGLERIEGDARDPTYPEEDVEDLKKRFQPGEALSYVTDISLAAKPASGEANDSDGAGAAASESSDA